MSLLCVKGSTLWRVRVNNLAQFCLVTSLISYFYFTGANNVIIDNTETNLVAFRRTVYLTINSSLDYEECAHKLLKMQLKPGQEMELCHMFLDCCAQQRTYEKFFGLLAEVWIIYIFSMLLDSRVNSIINSCRQQAYMPIQKLNLLLRLESGWVDLKDWEGEIFFKPAYHTSILIIVLTSFTISSVFQNPGHVT